VRANHSAGVAEIFGRPGLPLAIAAPSKHDRQLEREALRSSEWPWWIARGLIHHLRRKNKYTQARTAESVPQEGPWYLRWTFCLFVALAEVTLLMSLRNGRL
jgi:hypothetical protein